MYLIIHENKVFAAQPETFDKDKATEVVWWPDDLPIPELGSVNPYPVSKEFSDKYWSELRKFDYPDLADLADAIVKDDEEALVDYRNKCQAVKLKWPKPAN